MSPFRLETILVCHIRNRVGDTVRSCKRVRPPYCYGFVFAARVVQRSLFLSGYTIAGFVTETGISFVKIRILPRLSNKGKKD